MDFILSQIMTNRIDFINGVEGVLIKKTHKIKWHTNESKEVIRYLDNNSTSGIQLDI